MSKQLGQENTRFVSRCNVAGQVGIKRNFLHQGRLALALVVFSFLLGAGTANAMVLGPSMLQLSLKPAFVAGDLSQDHSKIIRIAQLDVTAQNWQEKAFMAIEMQKRLDRLARQQKTQITRNKKIRHANKKRKKRARPNLRKTRALLLRKKRKSVRAVNIVREPAKLQRCLRTAGYFTGVVTGRLDDATLLAYLAFREDKNLTNRPNNLYDPVIQKSLFALCPSNNLSDLNQIIARAMERKPTFVRSKSNTSTLSAYQKKQADRNRAAQKGAEPLITGSLSTRKEVAAPKVTKTAKASKPVSLAPEISSQVSFARDVLGATSDSVASSASVVKNQRLAMLQSKPQKNNSSTFAMKRKERLPQANSIPVAARTQTRVASSSSSPMFSTSVSIGDLVKAKPVNPNTCSPQNHAPEVAMSVAPPMSSVPVRSARAEPIYDDGPMITGSIPSSSPQTSTIRKSFSHRSRLVQKPVTESACLPQDLYNLLATAHGRKTDVSICKSDCLPAPKTFSKGQKALFAEQYNINWCDSGCLGIAQSLPLKEVMKIEREARVHVCMVPQVRLSPVVKTGFDNKGINKQIRSLYDRLPGGYGNEDNIAVIIGNRTYGGNLGLDETAYVNAAAMKALLIEQLGYNPANVIMVKDAKRADFVRLFGRKGNPRGELQSRLKANPDAQLLVYYAGHASSSGLGLNNYLLPVDTIIGLEDRTAYSLGVLYENLRELDARTTQLFLEAGFNADRSNNVLAPNIAERRVNVAPIVPVRGLAVFTAATGDQKPLVDAEMGLGLFTRYLISGLAGAADERPVGNGDRIIDSVELYVHLASKVRLAARKTLGLRQNPTFSRSDNLFLSQLSRKRR